MLWITRRMAALLLLLPILILLFSLNLRRPPETPEVEALAAKWRYFFLSVAAAYIVMIYMKGRIEGNQGTTARYTNAGSITSSSIMESVRDRDSPTSITSEYDVFLSFRGPDARFGIVDHLYHRMTEAGLSVFKDDEEIRHGEVIGGELKRAICSSRLYAVVFSRNYASSAWCLKELDMMADFCGGSNVGGKIILPIFYGADPADVKLRTGLYREALDTHKERYSPDVVKKWEDALQKVSGICGWDFKAIQGEGRFVQLIVQDILLKLRMKDQTLPDHLTGIDDRVFDMLNRLDCDSSGVRIVVLHGMGGIGKTTLASVVFNKLSSQFEGSSFISNVRESTTSHGGIEILQNKLSRDIFGGQYVSCNFDDGFGEIIQRIRGKRILLVLDDVDQFSQLEKLVGKDPKNTLGSGSRVIITTRDKSVCHRFARLGSEILHFYELDKLADDHALQLFSRNAFGTDEPPRDYFSISKQVVKTTGNLPLALVVIARHLCGESKQSWKYELEKLKKIPHKEVFKILKVSYDGLDWMEKEIFLDIACFREAMCRRYADYLWEARDLNPKTEVKVLINKSLIRIDSNGEFLIHDQLRDMGREIIRSEGLGRPEMCTRLWDPNDALKIMLQKKVSEKIIAMDLDLGSIIEEHEFSDEDFKRFFNLMYLRLKGTQQFIGDFGSIRETLMWLSWRDCNQRWNREIFKMSNLVVLEIKGGWVGVERMIMPNLRVLVVKGNRDMGSNMRMTPDVSRCLKLEIMVYQYFKNLEEIHQSVGELESLTYMKISHCRSLRSLPKELCRARALRELIVTHCKIKEVPESIGRLESLTTLDLRCNNIKRLPFSIHDLENLQVLHVADNPLDLEDFWSLSALEDLDLSWSNICVLWGISQLTSLKSLYLNNCRMLKELQGLPTSLTVLEASHCPLEGGIPEEIGSLSALERLDLSYSEIRSLPSTVRQLTSLKSLKLNGCRMLQELGGLPTSLTVLDASYCPLLEGIHEEIGNLSALEELDLSYTNIVFLPVRELKCLKSLKLNCCRMLQEVRGHPTSLTYFAFSSDTVGLSEEIRCTKKYVKRKITFWGGFQLGFLSRLKTLDWSFPDMASLQTYMEISEFTLTEMEFDGLNLIPSLTELSVRSSDSLLGVSNIGGLRGLRSLTFSWCGALVEIPGLEQLEMLEELTFHRCPSIREIRDLLGLKRLKGVTFYGCSSLLGVPRLIDECRLWISCSEKLRSFEGPYSEYNGESS